MTSKKRKLDIDPDDLINEAKKLFQENSPNIQIRPFKRYLTDEQYQTIHIRKSEEDEFREIYGRILCSHENCRHKSFKSRVSFYEYHSENERFLARNFEFRN